MNLIDLPLAEFAFPGPLRDQLVTAILSGAKTSTSGLVLGYERENEPLPQVGQQSAVVDSEGRRVAVIEITEVRVIRLADIDLQHALDEGEGFKSVTEWRAEHERFWHSAEVREELGDPDFTVDDDTQVLAQRFRLVHTAYRAPTTIRTTENDHPHRVSVELVSPAHHSSTDHRTSQNGHPSLIEGCQWGQPADERGTADGLG
jgi:uncharacterized protein YhfF